MSEGLCRLNTTFSCMIFISFIIYFIYRFYASLALYELIDEVPIHVVASKFKVNRGILQCLQQSASLFASIVTSFCNALNWELLGYLVSQFKDRLFFGVHQDLLDLMKIPIITSQRARALFKAGFHNLVDLSKADLLSIEKCLYDSISFDTKKREGESVYDEKQRNELRLVFITGKAGLTVSEAAKMIIESARNYLQKEIGLSEVIWSHNTTIKNADIQQEQNEIAIEHRSKENRLTQKPSNLQMKLEKLEKVVSGPDVEMENNAPNNIDNNNNSPFVNRLPKNSPRPESRPEKELNNHNQLPIKTSSQSLTEPDNKHLTSVDRAPMQIIDVFQNVDFFQLFYKKFHVFAEGGLSVAINAIQSDGTKNYNCVLADNVYIDGVYLCLGEKIVFYLNLQESGPNGLNFREKISFLREVLTRTNFTLKILDAREELKKIINCVQLPFETCLFEDPKIAHWLPQSNSEPDFNEMVSIVVSALNHMVVK